MFRQGCHNFLELLSTIHPRQADQAVPKKTKGNEGKDEGEKEFNNPPSLAGKAIPGQTNSSMEKQGQKGLEASDKGFCYKYGYLLRLGIIQESSDNFRLKMVKGAEDKAHLVRGGQSGLRMSMGSWIGIITPG